MEAAVLCPSCGSDNPEGQRFCDACGSPQAVSCPACGAANRAGARFCGECATPLSAVTAAPTSSGTAVAAAPSERDAAGQAVPDAVAERRLVSVLFADLVNFTPYAEGRDAEEVRETLSRYFADARDIIERYGGTVEKFIGDAVMAVWGAPIAHEDDPERAVRAALDLVEAARALGGQVGAELQLRAGVLTGEAAVNLRATDQGIVAGDLVNTASRLQSLAEPGSVLVGEQTYLAASGAIAFEPAGERELKGKEQPVTTHRALRVIARRGGAGRSEQLEAPFVGRAPELRLLKDFHAATAAERRPRLVSIIGQGGIGKSRLVWEFQKYLDGLTEVLYWHEGRSPAYGEGVSFWALAEMVKSRAGIGESEDPSTARGKLSATLDEWIADEAERRWLEPRLLHLLGVASPGSERPERESLFAAWRTFFERIAERGVVVMVFEDLQWADDGLLDFIDHVMDWSRDRPIYLVTLARPELLERRTDWGLGRRSFTSLVLEPLDDAAMRELLGGLVPGLPAAVVDRILARAEGIPLYAVETVRMLVGEGRVVEADGAYRPVGDLTDLSMPASLRALIAARLDALEQADRALLQAASVIGKTFTVDALAAVSGEPAESLTSRLRQLVRRELLSLEADPRSPEVGQYAFLQGLIREVAYGTLARRDRRRLHLAAARHFETLDDEGIAGALAEHYLAAYRAQPEGPEGEAVAAQARVALRAAAERARSLGSFMQALRFYEEALEVTGDPGEERALRAAAGDAGVHAGLLEEPSVHTARALELARQSGDGRAVLAAIVGHAFARGNAGRLDEAADLLEPARTEFADLRDTGEHVRLNAELARNYLLSGRAEDALAIVDEGLPVAERLELRRETIDLLVTRGPALAYLGRLQEAIVTLTGAVGAAASHGWTEVELRARVNLSYAAAADDPLLGYRVAREGLDLARHLGFRGYGFYLLGNAAEAALRIGEWDWALPQLEEAVAAIGTDFTAQLRRAQIRGLRGEEVQAELDRVAEFVSRVTEVQAAATVDEAIAEIAMARGDLGRALELARHSYSTHQAPDSSALQNAARCAAWLGDAAALRDALAALEQRPGRVPGAARSEAEAALSALEGRSGEALARFGEAMRRWDELGLGFERALCALDAVTMLGSGTPEARSAADEAEATFRRLGAEPLLERLAEARSSPRGSAAAAPRAETSSRASNLAPR